MQNVPQPIHHDQYYISQVTIGLAATPEMEPAVPEEYHHHAKVFSEEASYRLPKHTVWDHAIELLPRAPTTLPGRLLPLTQSEIDEVSNFVKEHLA